MMELKKVIYGYVGNLSFIGTNNRELVIAHLLKDGDVGVDLEGYQCEKCGFIYSKPHPLSCEDCDGAPEP